MNAEKLKAWLEKSKDRTDVARGIVGSGDLDFWQGINWGHHALLTKIEDGDFDE